MEVHGPLNIPEISCIYIEINTFLCGDIPLLMNEHCSIRTSSVYQALMDWAVCSMTDSDIDNDPPLIHILEYDPTK